MSTSQKRLGFVSTRLAGTDGVSLEVTKWAEVLEGMGHECFYFVGESDRAPDRTYLLEEAHFKHPDILRLNTALFGGMIRPPEISEAVDALRRHLRDQLQSFVRQFGLDGLIPQNALSLPMNVPLGLALSDVIAETGIPTIAHHHDFHWERVRFIASSATDYLQAAFPPRAPTVVHVVINSLAARQLALRTGASSILIPNVMDFHSLPPEPDPYAADLRTELGLPPGARLVLQPTRIVPRKRIELAIELARRLELECTLLITHAAGDEGEAYERYLREFARLLEVPVIFAAGRVGHSRGRTESGEKVYSLGDAYAQADLVTYPSAIEGFGNAFLEAVYYRRPIALSAYDVYRADIRPKGFRAIEFGEFLGSDSVQAARRLLEQPETVEEMVAQNYELGRRHYSFRNLESGLQRALSEAFPSGD